MTAAPENSAAPTPPAVDPPAPDSAPAAIRPAEIALILLILLAQLAWAAAFIRRSSVVVDGRRYYCLFDDALVSMKYAANWAGGRGLVWNEGERVEGYTNFLWVAVMALVHRFDLDPSPASLAMQIVGEALLLLTLLLVWRMGCVCGLLPPARLLAVFLLAGHYVFAYWPLEGMETGLLSLLVTLSLLLAARPLHERRAAPAALLVMGLTPLVRPEGLVFLALLALTLLILCPAHRLRTILVALLALAPLIAHLLWRRSYYGEWLPNTYYLKATNFPLFDRLMQGALFSWWSLARSFIVWVPVAVGLVWRFRRPFVPAAALFAFLVAYQCWTGGDAWPRDRFILPALPAMIVAAAYYIHLAAFALAERPLVRRALLSSAALVGLLNFNYSFAAEWLLRAPPYFTLDNERNIRTAVALLDCSDPDASVAVSWAGCVPYFADRRGVDLLGKCDKHVARVAADAKRHLPGHNKYDIAYSLGELKPDVIAAEYLDIFVDVPAFARYTALWADVGGKDTLLWVRFDTEKIARHKLSRTPRHAARP